MPKKTSKILNLFHQFLDNAGFSKSSIKNYMSDLMFFEKWFTRNLKSIGASPSGIDELIPFINQETGLKFRNYLFSLRTALKTKNRRLSTLRKFSQFLYVKELLNFDFAKSVKNLKEGSETETLTLLEEFKSHLIEKKMSKNTVKNYVSDVHQFFSWLEEKSKA